MDYEETVELEKNVKIKDRADSIYKDFLEYVKLDVSSFKDGKFKYWSDDCNATYFKIDDHSFAFICEFLHEGYYLRVTRASIFDAIKENYRGLEHFERALRTAKTRYNRRLASNV